MSPTVLVFLASGLFLGWSLGANDAANVFGTAVGSRMVRFRTAAAVGAVFVVLGAVFGGAAATEGLGKLGEVSALPGAFVVALAAATALYAMTRLGLPVSATQAIVGGILGWNLYSGTPTDLAVLARIASTWVACPILGALFALALYAVTARLIRRAKPHMVRLDRWTRAGLLAAGALGACALGANNIGNVMGVFVPACPFGDLALGNAFVLTGTQQLFLLGGAAIAAGVFFSRNVMLTVGRNLMPVSPVGAWVVVVAHSLVLFVFSSRELQQFLVSLGLPRIPLVPVSSSQAVVGALIGVGLARGLRGARQVRWTVLGRIAVGWVVTPLLAAALSLGLLFVAHNVFRQEVFRTTPPGAGHAAFPRDGALSLRP